jgi:thiol-disulfide isomerase/thioredoxin
MFYVLLLLVIFAVAAFLAGNNGQATNGHKSFSKNPLQQDLKQSQKQTPAAADEARATAGKEQFKATAEQSKRVQAPDFTLNTLSGEKISLHDTRGRYVLLNMWASWCGPCREEAPHLVQIDQTYPDKKLTVLGVNMTSQELGVKDVHDFVQKYSIGYPVLLDKNGKVMSDYHIIGIPTSYLLDQQGRIIHRFRGDVTGKEVERLLKSN